MPTSFISDNAYLAVKAETTERVVARPTIFLPLESADIKTDLGLAPDARLAGRNWKTNGVFQGARAHRGTIRVWCDPDTLGHVLNMTVKKGTTTGNATDGYTHPFTVDAPKTYTIEIPYGPFAQRFVGVRADELKLLFDGAKLKADVSVEALGQFSTAQLASAPVTTTVKLNQEYDLEPTFGLAAGDVLTFKKAADGTEEDATIASLGADGVTITLSGSLTGTFTTGDIAYLKRQTPSFADLQDPLMMGDAFAGFGADAAAAATAAASRATSTPLDKLEVTFKNNLYKANTTGSRDPLRVVPQVPEAQVAIGQLFTGPEQHQQFLANSKKALVIVVRGKVINPATPTRNYLKLTFNNVQPTENTEPLAAGAYLRQEQTLEAVYDNADGAAMSAEVVNKTATY